MNWRSHREKSRVSPVLLGAFVIFAVLVAFYLSATKDLPFSDSYKAHLQFSSANQIAPNAPVRIAGVNVGEVGEIESAPGGTARVTVELRDEGLPLHTDATAKIRPRTFLEGAFFVDIRPGSPSAPELPDGGVVPIGQTAVPVQLDQILSGLTPEVRDHLASGVQALGTALDGGGPEAINRTLPVLEPLFKDGARVAEALTGTEPHDLSTAISATSRVSEALARDRPRLGALVSSFSTVAAALADRQSELRTSIAGLERLMDEAPPALEAIAAATPPTRALVAELRPALRRAPATLDPAVPLARELRRLLRPGELPALLDLADPTVGYLASSAPTATDVFAGLREPVGCLLNNAVPTLKSPATTSDPSYPHYSGEPVYRELLYSLTGLASATRNYDGNGFSTRYYAGFDNQVVSTPAGDLVGQLLGLAGGDLDAVGTRSVPLKPAQAPPLRPDVPCSQNEPADLNAGQAGPGGFVARSAPAAPLAPDVDTSKATERALRRLAEAAG